MKLNIYFISNVLGGKNIGSRNQALGVSEALRRSHDKTGVESEITEYDFHKLDELANAVNSNESNLPPVVIAVGDDGVKALNRLPRSQKFISVLLGHEVPRNLESVGSLDMLAIPEHITDYQESEKIKCVRTHGVSHAVTREKVAESLLKWKDKFAGGNEQPVVVVMLGGTVDGRNYHPHEAFLLGKYAVKKAIPAGARIIATNSPRASRESIIIFNDAIAENSSRINMFFPCKGTADESPFLAMLGLVAENKKSCVIVTGDSVSMPCEAASIIPPSHLVICRVSNQNAQNTNFVNWMNEKGRAEIIGYEPGAKITVKMPDKMLSPIPLDAPLQIASAINSYISPCWPI